MPAVAGHGLKPHVAGVLVIGEVGHVDQTGAFKYFVRCPEDSSRVFYHQVGRPLLRLSLRPARQKEMNGFSASSSIA